MKCLAVIVRERWPLLTSTSPLSALKSPEPTLMVLCPKSGLIPLIRGVAAVSMLKMLPLGPPLISNSCKLG